MSDHHERLSELFGELCERDSDAQLETLRKLAESEPELAGELAQLLELDANAAIEPLLARIVGNRASAGVSSLASAGGDQQTELKARLVIDHPPSHERYTIIRKLGEGGLGVVYEAHDIQRDERVALKTFKRPGSDSIFRLKREFRSLTGIEHPNLVTLYDLIVTDEEVFFTMELVEGHDAMHYLGAQREPQAGTIACDESRLRALLPQLASGLSALHQAGKLHRDVKPSNVRVTHEGRVVLLDFGLAVDIDELENESLLDAVVGTIAYMSPEQACAERELGPATDWYAFGVLLYEALTGTHPFTGRSVELLAKKTQRVAPPPRQLVPEVADDLDRLCQGLLERNPERRVRGAAVLEALGVSQEAQASSQTDSSVGQEHAILGRDQQIASLLETFALVQDTRHSRTVLITGPSGIGKSSAITEFLRQLRTRHRDAVILRGRCYERETVSHRAMDEVVDGLSRFWRNLPELDAGVLCPQEPHLLPLLFPVLGRVAAVAQRRRQEAPSDPQERRDRAYAALRETFRKLATDRPVVVFIDDMQWADRESCALLADLLVPPLMPAVMLVLACRDADTVETGLGELLRTLGDAVSTLELPLLSRTASEAIVSQILGDAASERSERIVKEAAGNAFFLTELCRAAALAELRSDRELSVEQLVRARVNALSEAESSLLEIVAVAGQPLAIEALETAAALRPAVCADALRALRAVHLVRTSSGRKEQAFECYHGRVRDAVLGGMDAERKRALHLALAQALELSVDSASHRLAHHWLAAEQASKASYWALRAAEEARRSLDFSQAAELLSMAIEQGRFELEERRRLLMLWGDTLVEAGRAADAASAFAQALEATPALEHSALRLRMVQQLFAMGRFEQGFDEAAQLTRAVGWRLPRTPLRTLLQIGRNQLALRRMGDTPALSTGKADIAQRQARASIASELARSLSLSDSLRGLVCSQRAMLDGMRLDNDELHARLFIMRSVTGSARGDDRMARHFLSLAEALAHKLETPASLSYLRYGQGFYEASIGHQWPQAVEHFAKAMEHWRAAGRGEGWDFESVQIISLTARAIHGDMRAINRMVPHLTLQYARAGRRFLEVMLRTKHGLHHVLADKAEHAILDVEDALASWPDKAQSYLLQHFYGLFTLVQAELYHGRADQAARRLADDERLLRRSQLLRVLAFRIEYEFLHGRVQLALATGAQPSEHKRHRKEVQTRIATLAKIALPMATSYAAALGYGLASLDGRSEASLHKLEQAVAGFETMGARLFAAMASRELGCVLGGSKGEALMADAELWMAREDVHNPAAASRLYVQGTSS